MVDCKTQCIAHKKRNAAEFKEIFFFPSAEHVFAFREGGEKNGKNESFFDWSFVTATAASF